MVFEFLMIGLVFLLTLTEELKWRGLIAQMTHEDEINRILSEEKIKFYIGFDPTADSLHVGHLLQMVVMRHMQRAGHIPVVLIGCGTTMIGDPSGRTDMRKLISLDEINHNASQFKKQISMVVDFSEDRAIMVNNADWLLNLNYIEFLREIGVHFSVNKMLTAECFKNRLERGLSFIEFNYMLMQGYDFLMLYDKLDCVMQFGGDDQWSNIIAGMRLVNRVRGKDVYGVTFNLISNSRGEKMGKTRDGAVWLSAEKTTPYNFYQYWRNVDDVDVIRFVKMLTFLPIDEIKQMEGISSGADFNKAKEILAYEVTKTVHGQNEADKVLQMSKDIFRGNFSGDMPCTNIPQNDFARLSVEDCLVLAGLSSSKTDARRLISQGGVSLNGEVVKSDYTSLGDFKIEDASFIIRKGKKSYHKFIIDNK